MNLASLVVAYVKRRPLTWAFHVLTLAFGVCVVVAVLLLQGAMADRFSRDIGPVDLVVGAKGSPLQLILSSLFQIDSPTGNITLAQADQIAGNPLVAKAAPISMGDNVEGVRIVGTTRAYQDLYGLRLAGGRWPGAMEAVVGSKAARTLRLRIGQTFIGDHGLSRGGEPHAATPYRVVGILEPSGATADRLVLTDIASAWRVHASETPPGQPPQVTALLVHYRSAMGAVMLPQAVRAMPDLQAAVPAVEMARLNRMLGAGAEVIRVFGVGLLAISAMGFVLSLFSAVNQRRRELALLRTLGARPRLLVWTVICEGALLGLVAGALGVVLGRAGMAGLASAVAAHGGPILAAPAWGWVEFAAVFGAVLLGVGASLGPAVLAYRIDPARVMKS